MQSITENHQAAIVTLSTFINLECASKHYQNIFPFDLFFRSRIKRKLIRGTSNIQKKILSTDEMIKHVFLPSAVIVK